MATCAHLREPLLRLERHEVSEVEVLTEERKLHVNNGVMLSHFAEGGGAKQHPETLCVC